MKNIKDILPFSKKLSVLYIEENQEQLLAYTQKLQSMFTHIDDASDATMGLSLAKINTYDIIVLDAASTIMSTSQLVQNLRTINPYYNIIITTKEYEPNHLVNLYRLNPNCVVQKKLGLDEFIDALYALLKRMEYERGFLAHNMEKLQADLLYERKRIGRFMLNEKKLNEKIASLSNGAEIDKNVYELTRLPSKYALQKAINGSLQSLLYIDIDHFDFINTIYGMGKANKLLKEVAARLKQFLPQNGELFHITADEFVILLDNPAKDQGILLAKQIQTLFKEVEIAFDAYSHFVVFSIGIDTGTGKKLFVNAKAASKEAKHFGGNMVVTYNAKSEYMQEQRKNLYWIEMLKHAFEEDKILAYYQPIISNQNPAMKHYEVLCRVLDQNNQLIDANEFIQSAKLVGFVTQITKIIIDKAFKTFQNNNYNFSLNISMHDMYEDYLVEFLDYKCQRYNIAPSRVHLEIIEDIVLVNSEAINKQIEKLRLQGYPVVIDDFSTENSLYSRLFDLHAQYIKIDGSFTKDIHKNKAHLLIMQGIVDFAKKSGIKTIAEHIEDEEVYTIVKELGVDFMQGYLIAKPSASL